MILDTYQRCVLLANFLKGRKKKALQRGEPSALGYVERWGLFTSGGNKHQRQQSPSAIKPSFINNHNVQYKGFLMHIKFITGLCWGACN